MRLSIQTVFLPEPFSKMNPELMAARVQSLVVIQQQAAKKRSMLAAAGKLQLKEQELKTRRPVVASPSK